MTRIEPKNTRSFAGTATAHEDGMGFAPTKSRVFIVHPVKEDVSPAEQFGSIVYVNSRYIFGDELRDDGSPPAGFQANIISAAAQFDPEHDFLLLAGDHVQIVMLAAEIVNEHLKPFRVLRYDRVAQGYFPVRMMGPT